MLLNFLKRYAPVLMFIAVLGLSGLLAYQYFVNIKDDREVQEADAAAAKVNDKLSHPKVSPAYIGSPENIAKIKYAETLKQDVERIKRTADEPIGVFVSYPQPARVKSEAKEVIPDAIPLYGVLPSLPDSDKDFLAEAERGRIYIRCELPKPEDFKMMEPVRIEIFRSLDKNKFDYTKPWGKIDLGLEELPAPKPAGTATVAPVAPAEVVNSRAAGATGTARDPKKPKAKPFVLPPTERVFRDTTDLKQLTEYFYQARLVGRFTSKEGHIEKVKRADGKEDIFILHAPNDPKLIPVPPTSPTSTAKLFATPLTKVVSAKTLTNFDLRVSGINDQDKIPAPGHIRDPKNHNNPAYSANFELRVWMADTGKWETVPLQSIHEGEMLSGKIKDYDFTKDFGYKLFEINNAEVESRFNPGQKEVVPIIRLENQKTKAIEELRVQSKPPIRKESLNVYDQIIEAQGKKMDEIKKAPPPVAAPPAPPHP